MYTTPGSRGYLSGLGAITADSLVTTGAITADSLVTTGAVTAGSVASSGPVSGTTITGSSTVQGTRMVATTDGTAAAPAFECPRGGMYGTSTPSLNTASPLGTLAQTLTSGLGSQNGTGAASKFTTLAEFRAVIQSVILIDAIGDVIPYVGKNQPLSTDGGTYVLASTPTITGGTAGDEMTLHGPATGTVTIQDSSIIASGVKVTGVSRALSAGDSLTLVCLAANSWKETAYANVT